MNVTDEMVDIAVDVWHESDMMFLDDRMRKILMHVLASREAVLERELAEAKADAERGWKDAQERQDDAQAWAQTASQCLQMTHSAELRMQRVSGWLSGLIEQEKVAFGDEGVPIDTDTMEVVIKGVEQIIRRQAPGSSHVRAPIYEPGYQPEIFCGSMLKDDRLETGAEIGKSLP